VAAAEAPPVPGLSDETPMPIIQCPACNGRVNMPDEIAGMQVVCPLCQASYRAPDATPDRNDVIEASIESISPDSASDVGIRRKRRRRLAGMELLDLPSAPPMDFALPDNAAVSDLTGNPGAILMLLGVLHIFATIVLYARGQDYVGLKLEVIVLVLVVLAEMLVIYAGIQMRRLEHYTLVCIGTALGMLSCIGFFVGLWVFSVLTRPQVRSAFRS
jgi:hypothetical protein